MQCLDQFNESVLVLNKHGSGFNTAHLHFSCNDLALLLCFNGWAPFISNTALQKHTLTDVSEEGLFTCRNQNTQLWKTNYQLIWMVIRKVWGQMHALHLPIMPCYNVKTQIQSYPWVYLHYSEVSFALHSALFLPSHPRLVYELLHSVDFVELLGRLWL